MTDSNRLIHLRLPATSANLGPAFDTAAVALNLHLEVSAQPAGEFSISADGRDAAACSRLDRNLILETYRRILTENDCPIQPLHLDVTNQIPLGMGCGSSAAARLAGIALAVEFGGLGWSEKEIIAVATFHEGHPDNVTACWLGGMTVSAVSRQVGDEVPQVHVARIEIPQHWSAVVVFPRDPVRTEESRKVLPSHYSRADVVENLQHCSLLVAAFASGNGELLQAAMCDRLHQPYRSAICPLLKTLQPLETMPGVLGAALSGAGPGMLLIVQREFDGDLLDRQLRHVIGEAASVEVLQCGFENTGAASNSRLEASSPLLQSAIFSGKK
jgi:homoserine kinase